MRQPTTKYKDFYQFLIKKESHKNSNMEIKGYNS